MIKVWGPPLWQPCFSPKGSRRGAIGIMVCGHLEEGAVSKDMKCCVCRNEESPCWIHRVKN